MMCVISRCIFTFFYPQQIRGSIVVSISGCHSEGPGSIPGRGGVYMLYVCGVLYCDVLYRFNKLRISACESWLMESMQIQALRDRSKLHDNLVFSEAIHNILVDPWYYNG